MIAAWFRKIDGGVWMRGLCRLKRSDVVGINGELLADSSDTLVGRGQLLGGTTDSFTAFPLIVVFSQVVLRGLAEDEVGFDMLSAPFARESSVHSRWETTLTELSLLLLHETTPNVPRTLLQESVGSPCGSIQYHRIRLRLARHRTAPLE